MEERILVHVLALELLILLRRSAGWLQLGPGSARDQDLRAVSLTYLTSVLLLVYLGGVALGLLASSSRRKCGGSQFSRC